MTLESYLNIVGVFRYALSLIIVSFGFNDSNNVDVDILYKTDNYVIVNKPEDVFVNNHDKQRPSLDVLLGKKYPDLLNNSLKHGFYFVHRLDYVTSGVLCLALNKRACAAASGAMQKRISRKYYIALLRGHVSVDSMDLTYPIGNNNFPLGYCSNEIDGNHKMCTADRTCCTNPRYAHTRLVVLERGVYMSYPATKVLLLLVTGRRHQIRVHCSVIGHTIIGDYTYSRRKDTSPSRTFLHSYRLELGVDNINIQTDDPFTSNKLKSLWTPVEIVNKLGENNFELFNS